LQGEKRNKTKKEISDGSSLTGQFKTREKVWTESNWTQRNTERDGGALETAWDGGGGVFTFIVTARFVCRFVNE